MASKDSTESLSRRILSDKSGIGASSLAPINPSSSRSPAPTSSDSSCPSPAPRLSRGVAVAHPRVVLAFALALLVAASVLLLLLTYHFVTEKDPQCSSQGGRQSRGCERTTRSGLCVPDVFAIVDEVYRPLWPGSVDVLIRSYFSPRVFLLGPLWASLDLLWPRGIGRVILVLDEGDQGAEALVPSWVEVKYEKNYLNLPGKILQQWSYGWADNYSSAPFIAIMDDDVILNLKVTPPLLFNLSSGLPYVLGSKEQGFYRGTTQFFLGPKSYAGNFMVSLPFIQPRAALPLYREKIASVHPKASGGYDGVMQWWAQHGSNWSREQIAHTVMGNFLYNFARSMADFALEWTDHAPIPRVGVHVPYTNKFSELGGVPRSDMLNGTSFLAAASYYSREAVCFSFPQGEVAGCEDMPQQQSHIWRYAWDRQLWRGIRRKHPKAYGVYQNHVAQLHCMYDELVKLSSGLGESGSTTRLKASGNLVRRLQTRCLRNS